MLARIQVLLQALLWVLALASCGGGGGNPGVCDAAGCASTGTHVGIGGDTGTSSTTGTTTTGTTTTGTTTTGTTTTGTTTTTTGTGQ